MTSPADTKDSLKVSDSKQVPNDGFNSFLVSSDQHRKEDGQTNTKFILSGIPSEIQQAKEWTLKSHSVKGPLYDLNKGLSLNFDLAEGKKFAIRIPCGCYTPDSLTKAIRKEAQSVELAIDMKTSNNTLICRVTLPDGTQSTSVYLPETRYVGIELQGNGGAVYGGGSASSSWYTFLITPVHAKSLVYQNSEVRHVVAIPPNSTFTSLWVHLKTLYGDVYMDDEWKFEIVRCR